MTLFRKFQEILVVNLNFWRQLCLILRLFFQPLYPIEHKNCMSECGWPLTHPLVLVTISIDITARFEVNQLQFVIAMLYRSWLVFTFVKNNLWICIAIILIMVQSTVSVRELTSRIGNCYFIALCLHTHFYPIEVVLWSFWL